MKYISKEQIFCEFHGRVRIPPTYFREALGGFITMYCPQCEADSRDISLDHLYDMADKYDDFDVYQE